MAYLYNQGYGTEEEAARLDAYFDRHPELKRGEGVKALVMRGVQYDESMEAIEVRESMRTIEDEIEARR
jgi:hypothetical protein